MKLGSQTLSDQREGFVLVTVLLISSLLLSAATAFAIYARGEMRRASDEEFALVARSLARTACDMIGEWIAMDQNEYDSELEVLYRPGIPFELNFGEWRVEASISPQDRLIPINGIFLPDGVTMKTEMESAWKHFWGTRGDDALSLLVLDFLDRDSESRPGSAEREHFINKKIGHLSELLHIEEIDTDMLYGVDDSAPLAFDRYFTVYGSDTININVAPREVLAGLDDQLGYDVADAIIRYRSVNAIKSEKDLLNIPGFPMTAQARLANIIAYKSNLFLLDLKVKYQSSERSFAILLSKAGGGCKIHSWRE